MAGAAEAAGADKAVFFAMTAEATVAVAAAQAVAVGCLEAVAAVAADPLVFWFTRPTRSLRTIF
jgi:hypothetical protein